MPQELDWKSEYTIKLTSEDEFKWPIETGRTIYDMWSITGLNQIPVSGHMAYITSGAEADQDELPLPVEDVAESLIVEGTTIVRKYADEKIAPEVFQRILPNARADMFAQELLTRTTDNRKIVRVYRLSGSKWTFADFTDFGRTTQERVPNSESKKGISADLITVYLNGVGILYPAQYTFRRLEEIEAKVRTATNNAIQVIVAGWTGNWSQFSAAMSDDDARGIAVPKRVDIHELGSTAVVDQYLNDFSNLLPLYRKRVHMVELDDTSGASGVARRLVMAPMLNYVQTTRSQVKEIYKEAFAINLKFDKIITSTVAERQQELELFTSLRDAGSITPDEFKERSRSLIM